MNARIVTPGARMAGAALLLAAVGFITVFSMLAGSFDYPDILDRSAAEVLPRLLALGAQGRAVWAAYACVPLLLIPVAAGAGAFHGDAERRSIVRVAEMSAVIAAIAMLVGLMRWPTLHWEIARAWAGATPSERATLATVFAGANTMLGNFVGEFIGELFLSLAFILFSVAAWQDRRLPRPVSVFGMCAGALGLVAMWRNVTTVVAVPADINNAVLPLWLVVWGISLWRAGRVR